MRTATFCAVRGASGAVRASYAVRSASLRCASCASCCGFNQRPRLEQVVGYIEQGLLPITKDGKERTYTVNASTNIDEYVGKRIVKTKDYDLFRKFIVILAQDPEFETMLNIMGGYVGVDQKKQSRSTRRRG